MLGIILIVASTVVYNLTVILWAAAARAHANANGAGLLVAVARSRAGVARMALAVLAWGLEALALTQISLTLARVVGAAGLALLLVLARRLLGERAGRREVLGVAAIATGMLAVAAAPPTHVGPPAQPALWLLLPTLLIPSGVLLARRPTGGDGRGSILGAAAAGLAYAASGLCTKAFADRLAGGGPLLLALLVAGVAAAGLLGSVSELGALQRGRAGLVAPIMAALQFAVPIMIAPVIFGERWPAEEAGRGLLAAGLVFALAGVVVLAGQSPDHGAQRPPRSVGSRRVLPAGG